MPACFQLLHKLTGDPVKFAELDDAICNHFGVTPDPKLYYRGWYDFIGEAVAFGKPMGSDELTAHVAKFAPGLLPTLAYIAERYTSDAWREVGKR